MRINTYRRLLWEELQDDDGLKIRLLWEELQDDDGLNGECAYSLSSGARAPWPPVCPMPMEVERTMEEKVVVTVAR